MSKPTFKEKFSQLMVQMEELVTKAEPNELEEIKADLVKSAYTDPIICGQESEFDLKVMYKISGENGSIPYILTNHDELTDKSIETHSKIAKDQNKLFILPSIISEETLRHTTLEPYLLFFSKDNKLFMIPIEGSGFDIDYDI